MNLDEQKLEEDESLNSNDDIENDDEENQVLYESEPPIVKQKH